MEGEVTVEGSEDPSRESEVITRYHHLYKGMSKTRRGTSGSGTEGTARVETVFERTRRKS